MYVISTKSDKRTIDNIIERNKNGQNPVKFIMLGETYKLQKKTAFKIFVYDTLGIQFGKLMDKELNPGEYKASFSIYSVLPGGRYYLEIIFDDKKIYKRITIG
jgi:hypothetical protein